MLQADCFGGFWKILGWAVKLRHLGFYYSPVRDNKELHYCDYNWYAWKEEDKFGDNII